MPRTVDVTVDLGTATPVVIDNVSSVSALAVWEDSWHTNRQVQIVVSREGIQLIHLRDGERVGFQSGTFGQWFGEMFA